MRRSHLGRKTVQSGTKTVHTWDEKQSTPGTRSTQVPFSKNSPLPVLRILSNRKNRKTTLSFLSNESLWSKKKGDWRHNTPQHYLSRMPLLACTITHYSMHEILTTSQTTDLHAWNTFVGTSSPIRKCETNSFTLSHAGDNTPPIHKHEIFFPTFEFTRIFLWRKRFAFSGIVSTRGSLAPCLSLSVWWLVISGGGKE